MLRASVKKVDFLFLRLQWRAGERGKEKRKRRPKRRRLTPGRVPSRELVQSMSSKIVITMEGEVQESSRYRRQYWHITLCSLRRILLKRVGGLRRWGVLGLRGVWVDDRSNFEANHLVQLHAPGVGAVNRGGWGSMDRVVGWATIFTAVHERGGAVDVADVLPLVGTWERGRGAGGVHRQACVYAELGVAGLLVLANRLEE